MSRPRTLVAACALITLLAGCSSSTAATGGGSSGRLQVVASFYPLQFVAQRVGGDAVTVTSLTRPGVEPHDLELTPRDIASVGDAGAVLYVRGFQAAVDKAVDTGGAGHAFDAHDAARLTLRFTPVEEGQAGTPGAVDPHFWLDPTRLADVADAFARYLAGVRPAEAATFTANARRLRADLTTLDGDVRTGLARCTTEDLVTSHTAFGYLAQRYGLRQIGIAGLDPSQEPAPGDLARVSDYVRAHGIRTIYYETLVSPSVARTVAEQTGATTAVLDPLEGLTPQSRGTDYLQVMRSNLATLRTGQGCS